MTSSSPKTVTVYCGELCKSNECNSTTLNLLNHKINNIESNIAIGYEKFVNDIDSLSPRIIDLLQLAAHIFCADRSIDRGSRTSVNNESWDRSIELHLPVFDIDFWSNVELQSALSECLQFMTGDRAYTFVFEKAEYSPLEPIAKQLSLFTNENSFVDDSENADVILLSGGLDSLAGAIERLNEFSDRKLIAVNHKGNNKVIKTQKAVVDYLQEQYSNRIYQYGFRCHNTKLLKSKEETQRTRMFLFSAIAYAICSCFNKHEFFIYENGVTSINLPTQTDVINARASRTTHPKTIGLLNKFLQFFDPEFDIKTPYYLKTKEEILKIIDNYGEKNIISSSVSCSSSRKLPGAINHCGCCSQCIDRRFAIFATGLEDYDAVYAADFIKNIPDNETKQRLMYTLRSASAEKFKSPEDLFNNYPDEISNIIEYLNSDTPEDGLDDIYELMTRFGDSVIRGALSMQAKNENLAMPILENSFLALLSSRDYLKTPALIKVNEIDKTLRTSIPKAFNNKKPENENQFNDTIKALLEAAGGKFSREFPVIKFGESSYRADLSDPQLIIESKYLRKNTTPSRAAEGIAADITKIPLKPSILFIVYDPDRAISDDESYMSAFESKRKDCYVRIYR